MRRSQGDEPVSYTHLDVYKRQVSFPVSFKESDLLISVDEDSFSPELKKAAYSHLFEIRKKLESYILRDQEFQRTLIPHHLLPDAPRIARLMAAAAKRAGVGPMAAVAGEMCIRDRIKELALVDHKIILEEID